MADEARADDLRDALEALDQAARKLLGKLGKEYRDSGEPDVAYFEASCVFTFRRYIVNMLELMLAEEAPPGFPAVPRKAVPKLMEQIPEVLEGILMMVKCARDPRVTSNPEAMFALGALLARQVIRVSTPAIDAVATAMLPHQEGQSHGGRAPKRLSGIWQRVLEMVTTDPKITATAAWKSFPQDKPGGHETEGLIYRCSGRNRKGKLVELLVEVDDRTGTEHGISRRTFERYVREAKRTIATSAQ